MLKIPQLFASLEGRWKLHRTILNEGKVLGHAVFTKIPDTKTSLMYREDGLFKSEDLKTELTVYREYIYRLEQGKISAYFHEKNPRLFHTLVFDGAIAKGDHLCGCDYYEAIYHFKSPTTFTLDYVIKGPKKDLKIHTIFEKIIH
jgi:hypothetical protein